MRELNLDLFFETSAKTNDNIHEMFTKTVEEILEKQGEL